MSLTFTRKHLDTDGRYKGFTKFTEFNDRLVTFDMGPAPNDGQVLASKDGRTWSKLFDILAADIGADCGFYDGKGIVAFDGDLWITFYRHDTPDPQIMRWDGSSITTYYLHPNTLPPNDYVQFMASNLIVWDDKLWCLMDVVPFEDNDRRLVYLWDRVMLNWTPIDIYPGGGGDCFNYNRAGNLPEYHIKHRTTRLFVFKDDFYLVGTRYTGTKWAWEVWKFDTVLYNNFAKIYDSDVFDDGFALSGIIEHEGVCYVIGNLLATNGNGTAMAKVYRSTDMINWTVETDLSEFKDDFDDGSRDARWTDEPNNGTIVEAGDVLTMGIADAVDGNWWEPNVENAPFAKYTPATTRLTVITKLNNYVVNDKTQTGLIIGNTTDIPDNTGGYCISFSRLKSPTVDGLRVADVGKGALATITPFTTLPVWLRMRISGSGVGSVILFDYSTDGITWTTLYTLNDFTWDFVGLHAKNWVDWNAIAAPYEFFYVYEALGFPFGEDVCYGSPFFNCADIHGTGQIWLQQKLDDEFNFIQAIETNIVDVGVMNGDMKNFRDILYAGKYKEIYKADFSDPAPGPGCPLPVNFLSDVQIPLEKFEVFYDGAWRDLTNLDGKNYLEGVSLSLGGASMTPSPIGGTWGATLSNEDGIFHPSHPTSAYKDYFVTGRKARISIGARYGGLDFYWQRMIGFMDEPQFDMPSFKLSVSGADYMKLLEDTELKSLGNYWGDSETFTSISSDGLVGVELYDEKDAMDTDDEQDTVADWDDKHEATFESVADGGAGSTWVGKMVYVDIGNHVANDDVFTAVAGKEYKVTFWYTREVGSGEMVINMYQWIDGAWAICPGSALHLSSDAWGESSFYFTALANGAVRMELQIVGGAVDDEFRIDEISIREFVPYWQRYYEIADKDSKGPYYVTLDGVPVWQGEKDEGWYYAEDEELGPDPPAHPSKIVYFDINKVVPAGVDVVVYYFMTQPLENVVADLLVLAGLYLNQAAALADMDYTDPAVDIDQVWFEAGTSVLDAIRIICERCDYRFHFDSNGVPVFKPKPAPGATTFAFTVQKHIESAKSYQDRNEIWNRIIIKGQAQCEPVSREETVPSTLTGEASNAASIAAYEERTLTITNHLFQSQAAIDAMCASLLAEYKDPKLYVDVKIPMNPVPLELGEEITWKERLSPVLELARTGVIRDIKIDDFTTLYRCEI